MIPVLMLSEFELEVFSCTKLLFPSPLSHSIEYPVRVLNPV